MKQILNRAFQRRETLISELAKEKTDCYRLFHGAVEGRPGLSVDAYGLLTLIQVSHRKPLTSDELKLVTEFYTELRAGPCLVCQRIGGRLELLWESFSGAFSGLYWCQEFGSELAVQLDRARRDPQLFLDFRACKRWLLQELQRRRQATSMLNLFAYTCSVSVHAAKAGVDDLWSVDFSKGNLNWGEKNFRRNRIRGNGIRFLEQDCIGLLWGLSGNVKALKSKGKKGKELLALGSRQFDIVLSDPPSFSKGKFANVDLNRDPETVYRPAWACVKPGGVMVATNNSAKTDLSEFQGRLESMLAKQDSDQSACEVLSLIPDSDFPTFDNQAPLKVLICRKKTISQSRKCL